MNELLQEQLYSLQTELAAAVPGSPQAVAYEAQIAVLENEIAEQPVVPHIFPNFFPHGGGFHGRP